MIDPQYSDAVKSSFIKKPLRTVLMIDDAFPTYSDLCGGTATHDQKDRAAALYSGFRGLDMLCDIENTIEEVDADHLRKSDLIVLDYHLTVNSNDNTKAIQLLRQLATSHHFNTIVVYTAAPDQDAVWLDVIASLSGGWSKITASLDGEPKQHWERLKEAGTLPSPTKEAVMQFARGGILGTVEKPTLKIAIDELTGLGVPASHCSKIVEYLVAKELADRAGEYAAEPSGHAVGNFANGKRWIQVGNAFVVIMQKTEGTEGVSETAVIMAALNEALLDWRPNVVQVLISEIQNALELEGFAGSDTVLRKPDMQAALTYNLLRELGPIDLSKAVDARVPVMSLVDKVVDSVRRRLSTHEDLLAQVERTLIGDLKSSGWTLDKWPKETKLVSAATELARTEGAKNATIMFRLNHFLSTEKFRRAHLTTGTVFHHRAKDEYFAVASPACDLVAGQGKPMQLWATAISPMLPIVAIRLHPASSMDKALSAASQAEHLFLEIGDEPRAFKVDSGVGHQPSYEVIFARDEGRVRTQAGKIVFDGARLLLRGSPPSGDGPPERPSEEGGAASSSGAEALVAPPAAGNDPATPTGSATGAVFEYDTFEIVEQLRGVNAIHLLQLVGQHLSRVGLDFVGTPGS